MSEPVLAAADATGPDPAAGVRLLVVDADDRTRASMVGILGIRPRFTVVASTGQPAEAIQLLRAQRPDVVIVDPRLPDVSGGVALIRRIRAIDPGVHILAVGWSPDLEHTTLTAGAHGFMRKTLKPGDLDAAVGRCLSEGPSPRTDEPAIPDAASGRDMVL